MARKSGVANSSLLEKTSEAIGEEILESCTARWQICRNGEESEAHQW